MRNGENWRLILQPWNDELEPEMEGLTAYSQSSQLTSESEPLAVEAGTGYQPSSEVTFPNQTSMPVVAVIR